MCSIETPQTTPEHPTPNHIQTTPNRHQTTPNHHQTTPSHISPTSLDTQVHLRSLPYPLHSLGTKTTTTFVFPPFRFTPAILSLMCYLVQSNNLQTFEVINYTITLHVNILLNKYKMLLLENALNLSFPQKCSFKFYAPNSYLHRILPESG